MIGHDGALSIEVNVKGVIRYIPQACYFVLGFVYAPWDKRLRDSFGTHKSEGWNTKVSLTWYFYLSFVSRNRKPGGIVCSWQTGSLVTFRTNHCACIQFTLIFFSINYLQCTINSWRQGQIDIFYSVSIWCYAIFTRPQTINSLIHLCSY